MEQHCHLVVLVGTAARDSGISGELTLRVYIGIWMRDGGCDWRTEHGREELPHVRGQGQKPGGPHARRVAAKRSYPTSEIRGSGRECQAATAHERQRRVTQVRGQGRWPGGATPRPRLGAAAKRTDPTSKVRGSGREEQPRLRGQGWQLRGATHRPRPGAAARGTTPHPRSGGCMGAGGPRGAVLHSRSGGAVVRRYPSSKVRSSSCALLEQP